MSDKTLSFPATAFFMANRKIRENQYEKLLSEYKKCIKENNLDKASLISQKISLLYGLKGLYLYLPLQIKKLQKNKANLEVIDNELSKVLALILFAEMHGIEDQLLTAQKQICLELCDENSINEVNREAGDLASFYFNS